MNTTLPKYLAFMSTLLLLTACSAVRDVSDRPYVYDDEHSIAWNISNASGMDSYSDAKVTPSQKKMYNRTDYDFSFPELRDDKLNEASLPLTPLLQYIPTGMGPQDWKQTESWHGSPPNWLQRQRQHHRFFLIRLKMPL